VVSVDYPEGSPFSIVGFETPISVYEGTVRIPFQVQANATLAPGTHTANGRVLVQACDDQTCLAPSRLPLTFAVTIPGGAG
jgi:thiol:disulfide interchange protein DsbD